MLARGLFVLTLALPHGTAQGTAADDQYRFLVALDEKGLNDNLVREARAFLHDYEGHPKAGLARYRLAGALYELGRLEEARGEYERLAGLAGFEFASEVDLRLAQCELARGEHARARTAVERVLARGTAYLTTAATFLRSEALFGLNDPTAAEPGYLAVLQAADGKPFAAQAERALTWCGYRTKRWDLTLERAKLYLQHEPEGEFVDEQAWLAGESRLEAGEPRAALSWYERVRPGALAADALRGRAFALAALDENRQSAELFGQLVERHADSRYLPEALLHGGIQWLKAGEPARALAFLERGEETPELGYWKARSLAALERGTEALSVLERLLPKAQEPELVQRLQVARGDVLSALGRTAEATEAWRSGGSDYSLQAAAVAELSAGHPEQALRIAEDLLQRGLPGPAAIEAELVRAEAGFALQRYDQAEECYARVLQAAPEDARTPRTLSRLAWCRYLAGDFAESARRFSLLVQRHPAADVSEEARFLIARSLESVGDTAGASAAFARYLEQHAEGGHAAEALLRLARLEGGQGRAHLEQLLERFPQDELAPAAHYELAELLSANGLYEEALPHYQAVDPSGQGGELAHQATYGLAWARHALGQSAEAAALLRTLLGKEKGLDEDLVLSSLELLVFAERAAKNPDGAKAAYEVLAKRTKDDARRFAVAKVAALALAEADRKEEAQKLYERLLSGTSDAAVGRETTLERAWLSLDQGQPVEAAARVREVLAAMPGEDKARECLLFVGEAFYESGDDAQALPCYEEAARSGASEIAARACYKAGFAYLRAQQPREAARSFQALVERFPDSELVGECLYLQGEASMRAEDWAAAIAPLERLRREHSKHETWSKAMLRLGEALVRSERPRDAATVLGELLKREPAGEGAVPAELWRGRALAALGERRGARAAFVHVYEQDRGQLSAQAHLELGKLAQAEQGLEDALSEYLKVALLYAHEEEVAEALYRAGEVLEQLQKPEEAAARFREAAGHAETVYGREAKKRLPPADH